jgi:spore coat protein A
MFVHRLTGVANGRFAAFVRLLSAFIAALGVSAAASGATLDVYVFNNQFSVNPPGQPIQPAVISVGDTVRWVWIQGNHTTTSVVGSPEQWNAPINSSNQQFSYTFTQTGLFWYYCIPHGSDNGDGTASGMASTVTVLPAGPGACCIGGGVCIETSPADCMNQGGTYQGDGATCDPNPCLIEPVTVTLIATKDNVLYETVDGSTSNALGRFLYTGNTNQGQRRRSVVAFDLSAIPQGVTIQDAQLRLYCNSSGGAAFRVAVHRLTSDWGEGTSQAGGNEGTGAPATPGDATWLHTFFPNQFWNAPGGDFVTQASALAVVSAPNTFYTWTSATLIADVQHWLNMPHMNFGWIVRGDEASSNNTKRFDSRDSATPANHPRLIITYVPADAIGACCFADASCAELSATDCSAAGGSYQGDGTMCHMVSCPIVLEPFVDALPRPAVAQPVSGKPGGSAHYEIAMTEQFQQLHRDLPPTRVWGYGGSYPGPTIEAWRDETVTVLWKNDLRVAETGELRTTHVLPVDECLHGPDVTGQTPVAIVHLHGGKVAPESDGYPEEAFPPGEQAPLYTYPNIQPAATIWYHDHALGITRLNVMMGMAGFYLIRDDDEAALNLPSGEYEIPLAIQDRSFDADGSIKYPEMWHEHFFGDVILVNGKVWPYLEVDRGKYRLRLLNGSNSRAYTLALDNQAVFWQIGTDLGLLEEPVVLTQVTLLPGERADVIFDFEQYAPGTEIILTNSAPAPFPGFPGVGVIPDVMKFIVQEPLGHTDALPGFLVEVPRIDESEAVMQREFDLKIMPNDCSDHHDPLWTIDGMMWHHITEFPELNTTEIWTWRNDSGISHPMHMHLVMAQVLDRQAIDPDTGLPTGPKIPPAPNEMGWKDTVDAPPGYYTRVIMRFTGFTGLYPYHCHILEHEDHEMMRQFMVMPPSGPLGDLNGDGVVDVSDLLILLGAWGPCGHHCPADLNGDGAVDVSDLLILLGNWG